MGRQAAAAGSRRGAEAPRSEAAWGSERGANGPGRSGRRAVGRATRRRFQNHRYFPSLKNQPLKTNVFFQDLGQKLGFRLRFWPKCYDVSSKTTFFQRKLPLGAKGVAGGPGLIKKHKKTYSFARKQLKSSSFSCVFCEFHRSRTPKMQKQLCFLVFLVDLIAKTT